MGAIILLALIIVGIILRYKEKKKKSRDDEILKHFVKPYREFGESELLFIEKAISKDVNEGKPFKEIQKKIETETGANFNDILFQINQLKNKEKKAHQEKILQPYDPLIQEVVIMYGFSKSEKEIMNELLTRGLSMDKAEFIMKKAQEKYFNK